MMCLLFVLFTMAFLSKCLAEYSEWPVNCTFERYVGRYPQVSSYNATSSITEIECQGLCRTDPRCGLYQWYLRVSVTWCYFYHHSVLMWEDAGFPVGGMLGRLNGRITGSKKCEVETPNNSCNLYHFINNKYPSSGLFTRILPNTRLVTGTNCKDLCSSYSECKSARYWRSEDKTYCYLYSTFISDGGVECDNRLIFCGTYEKWCDRIEPSTPNTSPEWPVICSITRYVGKFPRAGYYTLGYGITENECQSWCEGDTGCGMYSWKVSPGGNSCARFQHSVMMWEEAGLLVEDVLGHGSWVNTGSKQCNEHLIIAKCQKFNYTDRRYPSSGYITYISTTTSSLTAGHCKTTCSLYSLCQSVAYYKTSDGSTWCNLYSTSTSDLGGVECGSSLSPCGTYKRDCERDCPTDISSYHGATACLPVGSSPDECKLIPGCCYVDIHPTTGLCLRPSDADLLV